MELILLQLMNVLHAISLKHKLLPILVNLNPIELVQKIKLHVVPNDLVMMQKHFSY